MSQKSAATVVNVRYNNTERYNVVMLSAILHFYCDFLSFFSYFSAI